MSQFIMSVAEANRGLCSSDKRMYKNTTDAKRAARKIWQQTKSVNRPYECHECKRIHLTTDMTEQAANTLVNKWKDELGIPRKKWPKIPKSKKKGW